MFFLKRQHDFLKRLHVLGVVAPFYRVRLKASECCLSLKTLNGLLLYFPSFLHPVEDAFV